MKNIIINYMSVDLDGNLRLQNAQPGKTTVISKKGIRDEIAKGVPTLVISALDKEMSLESR